MARFGTTNLAMLDSMPLLGALENSPIAVIITNRAGNIEYVNPNASEVTGYSVEECLGRNPRFLQSGLHPADFYRQLWRTITEGGVWRGEICNRKKSGDMYWESASIAPIRNATGEITHFVATKEDITERRRIEQAVRDSERRANMALDLSMLVHWELDVPTRTYTFDDRFYALYGTSAEREGGKQMPVAEYARRFLFPEDQPLVEEEIRRSLAEASPNQVHRIEHRFRRADGEERFLAVCYRAERDQQGQIFRMYGANQDITERRQAAQQLAEAKARTDAANRELEQSLARQQELEKLKEQLVGLLVHDLKSPLGSVLVNATYLNSEDCTESEQMPLIADVIVATQTMRRMVMDMLDVMRADGAGLVPRRRVIEVEALLKEAARPAIAQARESRHDITIGVCPKLVHAWVDPDLIRRVLENLLDNALKYAPEGTGIEVRADTAEDQLVLQVRDQGPGIPEAERGRIFEPYARLAGDADTKTRQSRGLGLAFCKLAVEAHGGSISVHERIPRGAVFTVRLPVTRPGPAD